MLDDALPLLQAIKPDQLAATLGALAYALEGRGEQLGRDLRAANALPAALNEQMPTIARGRAPARRRCSTSTTARCPTCWRCCATSPSPRTTVADQRAAAGRFLADTTDLADTAPTGSSTGTTTGSIQLGQVSRPGAGAAGRVRPRVPVPAARPRGAAAAGREGLRQRPDAHHARGHQGQRQVRQPAATSRSTARSNGPDCRGLPNPKVPRRAHPINDGYDYGAPRSALPYARHGLGRDRAGAGAAQAAARRLSGGTAPEQVPDVAVLLWGPLLRGTVVNAS